MKLADITKSVMNLLSGEKPKKKINWTVGSGIKDQIENTPIPMYKQSIYSQNDRDLYYRHYDIFIDHNNYYRRQQEEFLERMRQYAIQSGFLIVNNKLIKPVNKNTKIL